MKSIWFCYVIQVVCCIGIDMYLYWTLISMWPKNNSSDNNMIWPCLCRCLIDFIAFGMIYTSGSFLDNMIGFTKWIARIIRWNRNEFYFVSHKGHMRGIFSVFGTGYKDHSSSSSVFLKIEKSIHNSKRACTKRFHHNITRNLLLPFKFK